MWFVDVMVRELRGNGGVKMCVEGIGLEGDLCVGVWVWGVGVCMYVDSTLEEAWDDC